MTTPIDTKASSEQWEGLGRLQDEYFQQVQDELDALQRNYPGVALKQCSSCWTLKPAIPEFFRRNRSTWDGLDSYCKVCRNDYCRRERRLYPGMFRRYERAYRLSNLVIRRAYEEAGFQFVPSAKEKHCPKCGQTKPLTREYFHRNLGRGNGFNSHCKACRIRGGVRA
jgi:hypothetical protein